MSTSEIPASTSIGDRATPASRAAQAQGRGGPTKHAALHFGYADGLRALAVIYVFIYHEMIAAPELGHGVRLADLLMAFNPVDMFFVLSGFLLSGPFLKSYFHDGRDFPLVGGYALARALRALPVYYVGLAIISAYLWFTHVPPSLWDVVSHVLFLHDFFSGTTQSISGPLWTLAVDIQFYIVLPIVAWYFFKYTRTSTRGKRIVLLFTALGAITVACIVYRYLVMLLVNPSSYEQQIVYLHQLPGAACIFAAGIAVRALLEAATPGVRLRLADSSWLLLLGVIAFHPLDWALDAHYDQMLQLKLGTFGLGPALVAVGDPLGALACAMVILALAGTANPIARLLSGRLFVFASSISFTFYVYHMTVIFAFAGRQPHPSWSLFIKSAALSLAVLVPLSYVLYLLVEKPFLELKSTVRRSKRTHLTDWSDVQKAGATIVDARLFPGTSEQA